ncbi:MAG: UDP-galactopyranose mutase [Desulfarculaceae bacterium]|nr:UDP-galactopyranose mutase [Desulfarculaceae bacterium]MCF8047015.1 UDP-galactopyranose mutase [Desulfarculaceae bacterium]MCF8096513.1 UDP-galactopyranose mutase [Desulfarculaceae bacterium]MCF8121767.1 UDP-galactopyranose mutase [Desulfarculaceae bacterium]
MYDALVVGAGLSGLVMVERLCTQLGWRCLLVDRREHLGGNCYDAPDQNGVLTHIYGPHYFRTDSPELVHYLSRFTAWHKTRYTVRSFTEGKYWSFPVNLRTFEQLLGRESCQDEFRRWLDEHRVPIADPKNSEEMMLASVGEELYEKFFKGYTKKQWCKEPRDLHPSVCGRIPIRTTRDDSYVDESFQALPADGYTAMFQRMVDTCGDNLEIRLGVDFREVKDTTAFGHLIYTGPIDEYFHACHGRLEYRSLRFEVESFSSRSLAQQGKSGVWQPYLQVNYPNSGQYTRAVEIKHATNQETPHTNVVREYPQEYTQDNDPYYPVPTDRNLMLYKKYAAMAEIQKGVTFLGRLATYAYLNMDQAVAQALRTFDAKFASCTKRRHPGLA